MRKYDFGWVGTGEQKCLWPIKIWNSKCPSRPGFYLCWVSWYFLTVCIAPAVTVLVITLSFGITSGLGAPIGAPTKRLVLFWMYNAISWIRIFNLLFFQCIEFSQKLDRSTTVVTYTHSFLSLSLFSHNQASKVQKMYNILVVNLLIGVFQKTENDACKAFCTTGCQNWTPWCTCSKRRGAISPPNLNSRRTFARSVRKYEVSYQTPARKCFSRREIFAEGPENWKINLEWKGKTIMLSESTTHTGESIKPVKNGVLLRKSIKRLLRKGVNNLKIKLEIHFCVFGV